MTTTIKSAARNARKPAEHHSLPVPAVHDSRTSSISRARRIMRALERAGTATRKIAPSEALTATATALALRAPWRYKPSPMP